MKTISYTDTIFATVKSCGRVIFTATLAGCNSVDDAIKAIRRHVRNITDGLLTIVLRNSTQGWSITKGLLIPRHNLSEALPTSLMTFVEGHQLSLF